jgi:hypothetical protein
MSLRCIPDRYIRREVGLMNQIQLLDRMIQIELIFACPYNEIPATTIATNALNNVIPTLVKRKAMRARIVIIKRIARTTATIATRNPTDLARINTNSDCGRLGSSSQFSSIVSASNSSNSLKLFKLSKLPPHVFCFFRAQ